MARTALLIFMAAALLLAPLLAFCSHGEETHIELLGRCHAVAPACCAHAQEIPRPALASPGVSHTRAPGLEARIEGSRRDLPRPLPRVVELPGEARTPETFPAPALPGCAARWPGIPSPDTRRLPLLL